jgi:hypothetical protein
VAACVCDVLQVCDDGFASTFLSAEEFNSGFEESAVLPSFFYGK